MADQITSYSAKKIISDHPTQIVCPRCLDPVGWLDTDKLYFICKCRLIWLYLKDEGYSIDIVVTEIFSFQAKQTYNLLIKYIESLE